MAVANQRRVPISKVIIGDDEIEAVVEVLRSGNLREGAQCAAFEEEFAGAVGAAHALSASSGTAALHMAYAALLSPGDEVLIPAFTFFATASMVVAAGAIPIFCDVDPHTFTIDVEDAARRLTDRTRAIAPVHIFGNPVDVDGVRAFARAHNLAVVWDAAQAHGTRFDGIDIGSCEGAVCYSFYPSKNMTTGEGGMVCTDDAALANRMKLIRSQGQPQKYVHTTLGYNYRMTDIQAAIGRGQLRHLSGWIERRRDNAEFLRSGLSQSGRLTVQQEQPRGYHSYHQFSVLVDPAIDRDTVLRALRTGGVECAVHYPTPLHRQPLFAPEWHDKSLPVSEDLSERILSLPVHPYLSTDDLQYVAEQVLTALV
jgi:perosamine synthetase